jgi:hypothetical protein
MHPFGNRLTVEEIWSLEWFLRTIPNGGAENVPTTDMIVPFEPPAPGATPAATPTPAPTPTASAGQAP